MAWRAGEAGEVRWEERGHWRVFRGLNRLTRYGKGRSTLDSSLWGLQGTLRNPLEIGKGFG